MKKILFSIGSVNIPGYGFMIGIGFIIAVLLGEYRARKKELDRECVLDMSIIAIVSGFLGAKLLFVLVNLKDFFESPIDFLGRSGFVVYGGIIAGVLCCILYCHFKKISFLQYFDIIMPEVAIAQGFGRIGCFLAGCCYGKTTDSVFGVTFPADSFAPAGVKLIPTQLISAVGDFVIAAVLIIIADVVAAGMSKNATQTADEKVLDDGNVSEADENEISGLKKGDIGFIYLCLYGVGRFAVEFLRNDYRGTVGILSTSQFISLFIVLAGVALLIGNHRNRSLSSVFML